MKTILSILFLLLIIFSSCSDITCEGGCYNAGVCVEGECVCLKGYEGKYCQDDAPPKSIIVKKMSVLSFPWLDSDGKEWDTNSGPDIIFEMRKGYNAGDKYYSSPIYYNSSQSSVLHVNNINLILPNGGISHNIRFEDYDENKKNDYILSLKFHPYSQNSGYKDAIIINEGGSLSMKLEVEYIWE